MAEGSTSTVKLTGERPRAVALVIGREPSFHSTFLAIEPFRAANRVSQTTAFTIDFIAADPAQPVESMDIRLPMTATFAMRRKYDLVLVLVTYDIDATTKPHLYNWLRRQSAAGAHLSGVDAGPLLLAEAGLLKGHTVTCHWSAMAALRELCPEATVVDQIYVVDRNRSTCAGQIAILDLSMALLRLFSGETLYYLVGNELIYVSPRAAGAPQRELVYGKSLGTNPSLGRAQQLMRDNIECPLTLSQIAGQCGVSLRDLQYLFLRHLNSAPKKVYMAFRLQHARELLRYSSLSIRETGLACGFQTPSAYYKAFTGVFETSPAQFRRDFIRSQATTYGRNLY